MIFRSRLIFLTAGANWKCWSESAEMGTFGNPFTRSSVQSSCYFVNRTTIRPPVRAGILPGNSKLFLHLQSTSQQWVSRFQRVASGWTSPVEKEVTPEKVTCQTRNKSVWVLQVKIGSQERGTAARCEAVSPKKTTFFLQYRSPESRRGSEASWGD